MTKHEGRGGGKSSWLRARGPQRSGCYLNDKGKTLEHFKQTNNII